MALAECDPCWMMKPYGQNASPFPDAAQTRFFLDDAEASPLSFDKSAFA
jgi:hypothetical protein